MSSTRVEWKLVDVEVLYSVECEWCVSLENRAKGGMRDIWLGGGAIEV